MGIEEVIALLIKFGPPAIDLAEKLYTKWTSKTPLTTQDFADLRAIVDVSPQDRFKAIVAAKGIALDDPKVIEFLDLLK